MSIVHTKQKMCPKLLIVCVSPFANVRVLASQSHDSSPRHSKRSSSEGTHISSRVVTTYYYRSQIVSNVERRSTHLVLHKFFNFRFLVSPFPKTFNNDDQKALPFWRVKKRGKSCTINSSCPSCFASIWQA